MYVYTHLGLWLDWLLLLLLLLSFTSRLHSFPLPPSPSLYTLDQYFTYIRVLRKKKDYLLLVLWGGVLFDLLLLRHLLHLLVMVVAVVVVVVVRATLHTSHSPSIHNRVVSSNSSSSSIT